MLLNSNKTDKDDDKFILYKTVNNTDSLVYFFIFINQSKVHLLVWNVEIVQLSLLRKTINKNSAIIYSPSCCFKPVWLTFFCRK